MGIKVVHAGHVNTVLIGQQKQQNVAVERIFNLVAAVYGQFTVAFWMDLDIYIGNDRE